MLFEHFRDKQVLITGGMGFLGSNLALKLVEYGAKVTLVDAMIGEYGANLFNIEPIRNQVIINYSDILDVPATNYLVRDKDYVFHLAGQVDHVLSLSNPYPDIDINIKGTAVIMEALRLYNPNARLIYTGTRGQYGEVISLPVAEDAPTYPKGLHEISNLTAEKIVSMYHDVHHIPSILLRLTNIFGERAQMKHPRYGVVNWFIRLAVDNEVIKVFGDGKIIRDFLYVQDCIDAMLHCTITDAAYGEIINIASGIPLNFIELADTIVAVAGTGRWEFAPFSPERKAQEPGDFYADISKIQRLTGWKPTTTLSDGLARTIDFYRQYKKFYW
jgi:UDP-glucose 4-epimerase